MALEIEEQILRGDEDLQKIVIVLAHINNEPIRGNTKLQKIIFSLTDQIASIKEQTSYDADKYGPYSEIVEEECEYLAQLGILSINNGNIGTTQLGKSLYNKIIKDMDKNLLHLLIEYKNLLNDLTSQELLSYIYSAHPSMTNESVVYENLKSNMENQLLSMVKKQKISAERASELLNKSYNCIIEKMNAKKIQVLR